MDIERVLKEKKLKITAQRKTMIDIILKNDMALDANKLFSLVLEALPGTNFSTVYRNLNTLVNKKILCQIPRANGGDLYKLREDDQHHHHIICSHCGAVMSLEFCPMEGIKEELGEIGFTPESHSFEIYGRCKDCK